MTQTALEALAEKLARNMAVNLGHESEDAPLVFEFPDGSVASQPAWEAYRNQAHHVIDFFQKKENFASLSALTAPVGLEWRELEDKSQAYLMFNGHMIGSWNGGLTTFMGERWPNTDLETAKILLDRKAREWLRIPTQPNVTELVEAFKHADATDWDYLIGILNKAKRHDEDAQTRFWVAVLKQVRATLSRAKGG